jgi:LPXTG-motif cell wall-anchored protein
MASKVICRVGCAVACAWLIAAAAIAQPFDKRTYFTFDGPVAVPGVTLPAGKYIFRIAETSGSTVVQVLSGDGSKHYKLLLAVRAQRTDVPNDPEIRFMETAAGMPTAIKTWWYPGERTGWEFVYPKEQARLLARGTGQPILATETTQPEARAPEVARITPAGEEVPRIEEGPTAPTGPVLKGEIAPPTVPVPAPVEDVAALPKTATAFPFIALAGVLLLGGGAALRFWRNTRR